MADSIPNLAQRQIMLSFAYLAYCGEEIVTPNPEAQILSLINAAMPNIPPIASPKWAVVWGPVTYTTPGALYQDNLMFAAQNQSDPTQIVIAIRGTNFVADLDWLTGGLRHSPNDELASWVECPESHWSHDLRIHKHRLAGSVRNERHHLQRWQSRARNVLDELPTQTDAKPNPTLRYRTQPWGLSRKHARFVFEEQRAGLGCLRQVERELHYVRCAHCGQCHICHLLRLGV